MKQYAREQYNFDPIPFRLVSNQDHRTSVPGAILGGYYISQININGGYYFDIGKGSIVDAGGGLYYFYLGQYEWDHGPLVVYIPGLGGASGYDPVYFRIDGVREIEIVPTAQDDYYLMMFAMVSATDHISLVSQLVPVVTVSRDGSLFEDISVDPPFEIGRGFYGLMTWPSHDNPGSEHNNECIYMLKATSVGADPTYESFQVFRYDYPA